MTLRGDFARACTVTVLLVVWGQQTDVVHSQQCSLPSGDCAYNDRSLAGLSYDLAPMQGPPSFALPTFGTLSTPQTVYFDFCQEATGGSGSGNGNGNGGGTGDGDGLGGGAGGGSISDAIDASCGDSCAYAYAIAEDDSSSCRGLGGIYSLKLFDVISPASGVQMVYYGSVGDDADCELTLTLRCNAVHVPTLNVSQVDECKYTGTFYTPYGCPSQCLSETEEGVTQLCSGNGLCGYDSVADSAVCTCFTGFGGDMCDATVAAQVESGISGGLVFMIVFIVLLLVGGLGFIGYMYWRLYTVQTAKARAAYDNLGNRDGSGNIQIHV